MSRRGLKLPMLTARSRRSHDDDDSAHELSDVDSLSSALKAPNDSGSASGADHTPRSKALLRALTLHALPLQKGGESEKPKVVIDKLRSVAAFRCLIHLPPLAIAVTLITLNFLQARIADEISPETMTALQYAAKIHEMLMMSSLAAMFFSFLGLELLLGQGIPFGAAFAGFQINQLTFLWSPEIWGVLRSKTSAWSTKIRVTIAIVTAIALGTLMGPASASCMIPRNRMWNQLTGTFGFNMTQEELYPTELTSKLYDRSYVLESPEPVDTYRSTAWQTPSPWTLAPHDVQSLTMLGFGSSGGPPGKASWTRLVNEPSTPLFDSLQVQYTVMIESNGDTQQSAYTTYVPSLAAPSAIGNLFEYYMSPFIVLGNVMDAFATLYETSTAQWWSLGEYPPSFIFTDGLRNSSRSLELTDMDTVLAQLKAIPMYPNSIFATIVFVELQDQDRDGIIFCWTDSSSGTSNELTGMWLSAFSFELGWVPSVGTLAFTELVGGGNMSSDPVTSGNSSEVRAVRATKDWFDTTSVFQNSGNSSVVSVLFQNADGRSLATDKNMHPAYAIAQFLAASLSRMSPTTSSIFLSTGLSNTDLVIDAGWLQTASHNDVLDLPYRVPYTLFGSGVGYGLDLLTVRLSLVVLIIYCLLATVFTAFTLWTGMSIAAYNSVSEIVALCLHSAAPTELQHTSVGISTTKVFQHNVRIATTSRSEASSSEQSTSTASEAARLELVFPSDASRIIARVKPGTKYS